MVPLIQFLDLSYFNLIKHASFSFVFVLNCHWFGHVLTSWIRSSQSNVNNVRHYYLIKFQCSYKAWNHPLCCNGLNLKMSTNILSISIHISFILKQRTGRVWSDEDTLQTSKVKFSPFRCSRETPLTSAAEPLGKWDISFTTALVSTFCLSLSSYNMSLFTGEYVTLEHDNPITDVPSKSLLLLFCQSKQFFCD